MRTAHGLAFVLAAGLAQGQLTVQQLVLHGEQMAPATFFSSVVHNNGSPRPVSFEGSIRSKSGELVLAFTSQQLMLRSGATQISAATLRFNSYTYGKGPAGRSVQLNNRLPEGDYTFCLRARDAQGEGDDEACESYHMEELLFLDLVSPWNGDSIDETRPTLSWMLTGTAAAVREGRARIIVAPIPHGMSTAQALTGQVPVLIHPETAHRNLAYPPALPDLPRGQCYAWQAERIVQGRVVDRSEPWRFCVRKREEPAPEKYIRLDRLQPGLVHSAVDRRLYLRHDEPYAANELKCLVLGPDGRLLQPSVANDTGPKAVAAGSGAGINLFEVDLSGYSIGNGVHTLRVLDAKGREYEILFQSAR